MVDVCRHDDITEQKSYTLKRLNSLQVFITPDNATARTYQIIGCPR